MRGLYYHSMTWGLAGGTTDTQWDKAHMSLSSYHRNLFKPRKSAASALVARHSIIFIGFPALSASGKR